ncbi:MAG: PhoU family transcriptional regulator [Thermoplasmata archaeon]|nr:PhoU family transcriptional regulator [Thermoplasmata archaeon]
MKDTSELMVSLAYSALLYDNKDIAGEVLLLEEKMDSFYSRLKRKTLEGVSNGENVDSALVVLQIAESMETIADAALEIADVVLRDIELHPVVQMSIMDSDSVITSGVVSPSSSLVGATLGEKNLASETGMWIIAIRRERWWIYGPHEDTRLEAGDVVIAEGPPEALDRFKAVLDGREEI